MLGEPYYSLSSVYSIISYDYAIFNKSVNNVNKLSFRIEFS